MNKFFDFLKIHVLAFMCWVVAFLGWKDYFTNPHQLVDKNIVGTYSGKIISSGQLISLPSGYGSGYYVLIENTKRNLVIPFGIDMNEFTREVPDSSKIDITFSPEEDLMIAGKEVVLFSLKYNSKEYISHADLIDWYNKKIIKQRNFSIYTTLGGFFLFGIVWWIRKRFFRN